MILQPKLREKKHIIILRRYVDVGMISMHLYMHVTELHSYSSSRTYVPYITAQIYNIIMCLSNDQGKIFLWLNCACVYGVISFQSHSYFITFCRLAFYEKMKGTEKLWWTKMRNKHFLFSNSSIDENPAAHSSHICG